MVTDPNQHKDKWMVDSGCTDLLSPYLDDFVSKEDHKRNCKTANSEIHNAYMDQEQFYSNTIMGNAIKPLYLPEFIMHPMYHITFFQSRP